nr:zinc-ribbon domain-containing protein [Micromonospora sp. DSM 115978]
MIVCSTCGTTNRDDERFCGECGAFLEWEGTRVDRSPGDNADQPQPEPASQGGPGAGGPGVLGAEGGDAGPTAEPVPAADRDPVAVQPGQVGTRRLPRPAPRDRPEPVGGDLTCPRCQTGNDRSRRFCRICGADLIVAEVVRRSWWQRLLDRLRRPGRRAARRTRRPTGMARRLVVITTALCLLAVLAVVGRPLLSRALDEIRDNVQDPVPLIPSAATASSVANRDTSASRVADGATNRYWAPDGPAVGAWVEVSFTKPVRLLNVVVHSGIGTAAEQFLTVGRPDELDLTAIDSDGALTSIQLKLRDQPGPQTFDFEAEGTVRVRIAIRSTYGAPSEPTVAIGEVEFFGRS